MSFEKGHAYYGYTEEDYQELLASQIPANLFFEYTYNGQTLYWIDAAAIEDFDFGMIEASWMAVYGASGQAFQQL